MINIPFSLFFSLSHILKGNTRVIGQKQLEAFREAMSTQANDPYTFLLRQNKLPMSLLVDNAKISRMHVLETDPFSSTFGPKAQRKRPKLKAESVTDIVNAVSSSTGKVKRVKII